MTEAIPIVIGIMAFVSVFLITSKNLFRSLLGFMLFSQVLNLFLFTRGRLEKASSAFVGSNPSIGAASDPLVQALILTAIVISFAMLSFAVALFIKRSQDKVKA